MKRTLVVLAILALGSGWMNGCASKQNQIVAQVGKDKITVGELAGDFVEMRKTSQIHIMDQSDEEQLRQFLEQKIDGNLVVQSAYEKGFDQDPLLLSQLEEQKERLLLDELFRQVILSKIKATDKDVLDFYKKLGERIKVRHILVKTRKEADQIYRELKKGVVFDSLAKEKSIDPGTKDKGGDLGYITWNVMMGTPFKEAAFKLKPQEISRPVKTIFGWHIIKLDERRKEEQKSFEEEKERLKMSLEMMRQREAGMNYVVNLMEKSDIKVVSSTKDLLLEKAKALAAADTTNPEFQTINIDPNQLSEQERALPFIRYKGGELKVNEFLQFYNRWPPFQRPPLEDGENVKGMVFNYLLAPELLKKEALRRGVDKTKGYKDKLNRFKEGAMAEKYRNEVILKDLAVDSADLENFYQRNKERFVDPAKAHILEIMVKTEEEAQGILKQLLAGTDFKKLAQEKTIRAQAKNSGGDLGFIMKNTQPELFEAASDLKPGKIGGPIHILQSPAGEGYSVIKLIEKQEPRQKRLDEVEPQVRSGATYEKKNTIAREWVAEARTKTQIKINEPSFQAALEIALKELPPKKN